MSLVRIEGYAAIFGQPCMIGDIIEPGAFTDSLSRSMPRLLAEHRTGDKAGEWLEAFEDETGLMMRGEVLPQFVPYAGLSIGFRAMLWKPRSLAKGRFLKELELVEVSVVRTPMQKLARFAPVAERSAA